MKKKLLLVALAGSIALAACPKASTPPSPFDHPAPLQQGNSWFTPDPAAYHTTASVSVVSLQAGTITELPLTPIPDLLPAPQLPPVTSGGSDCLVVVKRTPTQQIASLDQASCKGELIWLDVWQGEVLLVSYGITTNNQVIATGDVEISREDGGLIVRGIGAASPAGLPIWSA